MAFSLENESPSVIVNDTATTTPTFSFGFTATEGRLLVLAFTIDKSSGSITKPGGWDGIIVSDNSQVSAALAYKAAAGGEDTCSPTMVSSQETRGVVCEFSLTDDNPLYDGSDDNYESAEVGVCGTGTATGLSSTENQVALYVFGNDTAVGNNLNGYTNGTEIAYDFDADSNNGPGFALSYELINATTATNEIDINGSDQMVGLVVAFYEGAAAGGTTPKGPLGHPLRGPFGGPI